jgi:hypothetical protein
MTDSQEAILVGGPRDGEQFHAADSALVELEIDKLLHRYIRTTATRETDGQTRLVYNYDGVVRPATPGEDRTDHLSEDQDVQDT